MERIGIVILFLDKNQTGIKEWYRWFRKNIFNLFQGSKEL